MVSPFTSLQESKPQGEPIGERVKDCRKSECPFVMEGIGFELLSNINPCESKQTSAWLLITKNL